MSRPGEGEVKPHPWYWRFTESLGEQGGQVRLAPVLEDWERLEERPGAVVLKANLQRQVIALPGEGGLPDLVVKRYRMVKAVDRLKTLCFASRAEREWQALRHLARVGITAPLALAVGEQRVGSVLVGAGLVMLRVPDATVFPDWWNEAEAPARDEALDAVGELVGSLHASGLDHADLHLGNVLMPDHAPGAPVILDLHSARIGAVVPPARRIANLGQLYHSFGTSWTRRERHRFLAAYRRRVPDERRDPEHLDDRLLAKARKREQVRLASRSRRCWKNTTEFVKERRGAWVVHRRRDFDPMDLEALLTPRIELAEVYKRRGQQFVGRIELPSRRSVVVKGRDEPTLWRRLVDRALPSPLARAWGAARSLDVRGVPNPAGLAYATQRRFGLPTRTLLVTEHLATAVPLHRYLMESYLEPRRPETPAPLCRRRLARLLADFVRSIHDRAIYHRDLNPMNILIDPEAERFWLVDLDSIHLGRTLTERRREKNLVQIGLLPEGHVHNRDRLRFLLTYDRGDREFWSPSRLAELWRRIGDETVAIIARLSLDGR